MRIMTLIGTTLLCAGAALAQTPERTPAPPGEERRRMVERQAIREVRAGVRVPRSGKWWKNSEIVQKVGLSDSQVQEMEKIFQEHRLRLIDLHATLQKEETRLEPLIESDQPNEAEVAAQIDRVASARGALEKANAMMYLGIRKQMSTDQWKKLQEIAPPHPPTPHAAPAPPMAPMPGEGPMRMKRPGPPGELE